MMSKWCKRKDKSEAIIHAHELADIVTKHGLKVVRVKVEAMLERNLDVSLNGEKDRYFEFHMKIVINNISSLKHLINLMKGVPHVGVSLSIRSETQYPILTIRLHTGTAINALVYKDQIIDNLKKEGFHISEKIQNELSVYDTFPELDEGWVS